MKREAETSRFRSFDWRFVLPFGFVFLFSCGSKDPKFQQYYVQGEQLYIKHCSNCHQKNGKGLGLVYPPLDKSDFMDQHLDEVLCLVRHGRSGEILVNGRSFNKPMPGIPQLTDLEIAEIATYLYNTGEHSRGLISVQAASEILDRCVQ